MEIAAPIVIGCATAANAVWTYMLSTRIKSDEEKIKQGGEQLNTILKEYDSHIKYIYNLKNVCDDYRLAWNDMYSRPFLKSKGDVVIRNQYFLLRNKIDHEICEEINKYIQEWKLEDIKKKSTIKYRIQKIESVLKKNNIKYKLISGCQKFDDDGLLFLIYSFLSIIAFSQIIKKNKDNIHASLSNENDYLHSLLNKIPKLLNIKNNNELSIPINLQNCLGEKMIEKDDDNCYEVISFSDFKDKINNQYLEKHVDFENVISFDYYLDSEKDVINYTDDIKKENKKNLSDNYTSDTEFKKYFGNLKQDLYDNVKFNISDINNFMETENINNDAFKRYFGNLKQDPYGNVEFNISDINNLMDNGNISDNVLKKYFRDLKQGLYSDLSTNNIKMNIKFNNFNRENYYGKTEEKHSRNMYKIWMIQNNDYFNKWLEEEFSLIKYFDQNFFKNFKKLCSDCYKLQELLCIKNEKSKEEQNLEKPWINALVCLMYTTIINIFEKNSKEEYLSELNKIFKEFIIIVCNETQLDFSISRFKKHDKFYDRSINQVLPLWLKGVEKKINSEVNIKSKIVNICQNKKEYKFFKEIILLNNHSLHPGRESVHGLLYKDNFNFRKEFTFNNFSYEKTGYKKTNKLGSYKECNIFIYKNMLGYVTSNQINVKKIVFLDQDNIVIEEEDGYIKIYRKKQNLVFVKTTQKFDGEEIKIFPSKDDEIYTREYLKIKPQNNDDLKSLITQIKSINGNYIKIKDNQKNSLCNSGDFECIQYLDDPFKDEETFLQMKKKISSEYSNGYLDISYILRGIQTGLIKDDDREILDFFKNIFYEFLIKHEHRIFKEIGDICCDLVKESKKLIKKDIKSRQDLLNNSSNGSLFNCFSSNGNKL